MPLYTQEEVEVYTRMLARSYEYIRDTNRGTATEATRQAAILREIERTLGWNVPPPMKFEPGDFDRPQKAK